MKGTIVLPRMPQFFQGKWLWPGVVLALLLITTLIWCINGNSPLTLLVDNKPLVVVEGEGKVTEVIDLVKKDLEKQYGIKLVGFDNNISFDKDSAKEEKPVSAEKLQAVLRDELDWQAECWTIKISGKPDLYMKTEDDANKALETMKQYYLPEEGGGEVEHVAFAEEVRVVRGTAPVQALQTPEIAVEVMVKGLNKIVQHTVKKGDTLWAIARDNSMSVAELKAINPELKSDFLKPGQILNLVEVEPLLTVMSTIKTTVEENIQYKTIYETDSTLWRGQERVKQPGEYGKREVTYRITKANDLEVNRETLQENILLEPVTRIVIQGTKRMVASRGDGGSGRLGWPLRGRITCPYGKNRGSWGVHSGIDIDGVVGDPIFAAEDGVVIQASYQGANGKSIVIDHGNGLSTLYGHLNNYKVTVGQKVSRGDLIGEVGLTGRTTGSHLHFEVRVNNVDRNPMNYLD